MNEWMNECYNEEERGEKKNVLRILFVVDDDVYLENEIKKRERWRERWR